MSISTIVDIICLASCFHHHVYHSHCSYREDELFQSQRYTSNFCLFFNAVWSLHLLFIKLGAVIGHGERMKCTGSLEHGVNYLVLVNMRIPRYSTITYLLIVV